MGIMQDALLGAMLFTQRDTFIEKELVMNLLILLRTEGHGLSMVSAQLNAHFH